MAEKKAEKKAKAPVAPTLTLPDDASPGAKKALRRLQSLDARMAAKASHAAVWADARREIGEACSAVRTLGESDELGPQQRAAIDGLQKAIGHLNRELKLAAAAFTETQQNRDERAACLLAMGVSA